MNIIRRELRQYMSEPNEDSEGKVTASFVLPSEFSGFQGHFPGGPVLPGVCEIQAVMVALEAFNGKKFRLKEIVSAKFFAPVSFGEEIRIEYQQEMKKNGGIAVTATITSGEKKVSKLKLRIEFNDAT